MRFWIRSMSRLGVGVGLLVVVAAALAQQSPKDCTITGEDGKTVVWPNCVPPAGEKSHANEGSTAPADEVPASKRFPFPGEPPAADTPAPVTPGATTAAPTDGTPATGGDAKAPPPGGGGLQDAGSSGSSSSSSSDSSSSSESSPEGGSVGPLADDDQAAKEAAARKAARHKLPPVARQSPDEREQEDLKVASFYMDDKNFRGAYNRATDAVTIAADDADAHFALAEAARKLGKLDEALTNYKKCLTLDPVPKVKKAAEKAVKEMSGG